MKRTSFVTKNKSFCGLISSILLTTIIARERRGEREIAINIMTPISLINLMPS